MRNRLERRRLALRTAAWGIVLVLLCGCLLPAFAEGGALPDSVPGQTQEEDEPDQSGADEDDAPEEQSGDADDTKDPAKDADSAYEPEEYFETVYTFWLSERDEADGGLPYAEQTVGSGGELLMPEDPEADGKVFRCWYSRNEEGAALRFTPPEGELRPEADGECSLYAYFTAEKVTEPVLDDEDTSALPGLNEDAEDAALDDEAAAEEADKDVLVDDPDADDEENELTDEDEEILPEEEAADEAELFAADRGSERAAVFLLKTPTCLPGSNDPSQWAPDNSECRWIGRVNTSGAVWSDGGRNILSNVSDHVVSWPDGSTGDVWTLEPGDTYWNAVVNEIWDEYKAEIEEETGITGLTQSDLESLAVTPYKISRNNNTNPDKHIDCTISVRSKKSFTARFNVRAPGADSYTMVDSHEYQSGERVELTDADVEQNITIGGVLYTFAGWYREVSGPVVDEPGTTDRVTQDEWDEGYLPTEDELANGVVNFYAHYVLAEIEPDTGVTVSFFAVPLVLGAAAAGLGCKKRKKEEDA